ncbi:MAG: Hsp70 family protein [bacterium]
MILGIDLGTTNSLAGIVSGGKVEFVEFDQSKLLPSVVAIDNDRNLLIGQSAKNQYYLNPGNSIKSIKRLMGSSTPIQLDGTGYLPEEISGLILRHIKSTAEKQFGRPFPSAVITVPAYFSDGQRKATAIAGEIAGFKVERIINEPTAASLAYNYNRSQEIKAVVYDFGGGTFDVSVVNISRNLVEVVASHGDNRLGGDDIDEAFARYLADRICEKYPVTISPDSAAAGQLSRIAEKCKIELSTSPYHTIVENLSLDESELPLAVELEIRRPEFEKILQPFLEKTMNLVHIALDDARLNADDIDQILLVGGTSKIPLVAEEFEKIFAVAPSESINPDLSICFGAAVQGAIINDDDIDSILVDITPHTFGTRASVKDQFGFLIDDDIFVPVIKRNSPLPTRKSELFFKTHPEQKTIEVQVLQGDCETASDNRLIGSFKIMDLSPVNDNEEILLTMNLDLNGILTVTAVEKETGHSKQIQIDNSFDRKDISKSIDKLTALLNADTEALDDQTSPETKNLDEKSENRIYIAQTMIDKAESKFMSANPDDVEEMRGIIVKMKQAIEDGDIPQVEDLTDRLTDILFYLD